MKKVYTHLQKIFLTIIFALPFTVFSQTTIIATNLPVPGDTLYGDYFSLVPAAITFNIENTNDSPVILKQVEMIFNYAFIFSGTIPRLWYSATSLAGPSVISETGEWTLITTGTPVNFYQYGYYPLFQNLAFAIPAHTQYRFAVESSRGFRLDSGNPINTYNVDGIILRVGDAASAAGNAGTVGLAGEELDLHGPAAYFAGRITLEPATATPVTLLNFTATYNNKNANLINWQTSQEFNSSHFNVQRAYTLPNFATIKTLPAAGNSSTIKNYAYTDNNIEYKPTFYRLQQVDKDGQYTYSKTVQVNPYKDNFTISNIYPNPAHGSVTIEYNSNNRAATTLLITDMAGRQVQKNLLFSTTGFNNSVIDITTLAKGKYVVTLISNEQTAQGKFVKY